MKFRISLLALAVSGQLLLSGCATAPDASTVQQVDSASLGVQQASTPTTSPEWWKAFGDTQLNALVDRSLQHNPSLTSAMARLELAQANAMAVGASLLPSTSLNAGMNYERVGSNPELWSSSATADLNWSLDFWGKHKANVEQAQKLADGAALDIAAARLLLAGAIAQSYTQLDSAYAFIDIAKRSEKQRQQVLEITQRRVDAGLDTVVELKTAEAALPQARMQRLQAENELALAIHSLAALSGQGISSFDSFRRPTLNLNATLPKPSAMTMDILARRPDVLAAKVRVEGALAGKRAAKAAFYPDVSISAFAGMRATGNSFSSMTDNFDHVVGAGPALHLPFFQTRQLKAGFLSANANTNLAISDYNQAVLSAVQEVSDQLSTYQSLLAQQAEVLLTLNATETAYKVAQQRYQAGLISQLVLLNAETNMLTAQRDLVTVNARLVQTQVALILTTGGSFNPNEYSSDESAISQYRNASQPSLSGARS